MNDSTRERGTGGFVGLTRRFPLTVFLILVFGLSYPLTALAIMAQYGVIPGRSLPQLIGVDMERAASILLVTSLITAKHHRGFDPRATRQSATAEQQQSNSS